jgi:hypothetical protein
MVCPLGSDCHAVIESEFSHFLGIPVEMLGLFYYAAIAITYAIFIIVGNPSLLVSFLVFLFSLLAFLFSMYLTFIQVFTLRQLCTWCLTSAGLTTLIFGTVWLGGTQDFGPLLQQYRPIIIAVHLLGLTFGIGGATATDLLFMKFLKDFKISHFEADTMRTMSQLIWFGLALLIISGVGLFFADPGTLIQSSKFLAKMVVVIVIILNGFALNLYITPRLVHMTFDRKHPHAQQLHRARHIAFALGAISFTSWYTAFILGSLRSIPLSLASILSIYFGILVLAVIGSQIAERIICRPKQEV